MRLAWIALVVPFAAIGYAQYTPGTALHPGGTPTPLPAGAPIEAMGGYGQRPSSSGSGRGQALRARTPHPPHERLAIIPVYFGGGGYFGDGYAFDPQPAPPQPHEPPIVIINQAYRPEVLNPVVRDYSDVPLPPALPLEQRQAPAPVPQPDPSPTIYLIALNDGSIVAALGYWMEGDTLNYITRDANRNRISIDRVDREFSVKLNADRKLEFKLQ